MDGQASVEFLVILSVALIVFIGIIGIVQNQFSDTQSSLNRVQGKNSLKKVVDAADFVWAQGEGAKTRVFITIPSGVEYINIGSNYIEMGLDIEENVLELFRGSDAELVGSIGTSAGGKWVYLQNNGASVRIGEFNITSVPEAYSVDIYAGMDVLRNLTVVNAGPEDIVDIQVPTEYPISSWITVNPDVLPLSANSENRSEIQIQVPSGTASGLYYGKIRINSSEDLFVDLNIQVRRNKSIRVIPGSWTQNLSIGESMNTAFSVCNNGDTTITGVSLSRIGSGEWFIFDEGLSIGDINPGDCSYETATILVPGSATSGLNSGNIIASNSVSDSAAIQIYVESTSTTSSTTSSSSSSSSSTPSTTTTSSTSTTTTSTSTTSTSIISTCNDYCGWLGHSTGTCRANSAQCTGNGEVYESGGDSFCTEGPPIDTCCCAPSTTTTTTNPTTTTTSTTTTTTTTTTTSTTTTTTLNYLIHFAGFESGLNGWTDGGTDCMRTASGGSAVDDNGASGGGYNVEVQDDTSTSWLGQSFDLSNPCGGSPCSQINLEVYLKPNGYDNPNEGFDIWCDYGGATAVEVGDWKDSGPTGRTLCGVQVIEDSWTQIVCDISSICTIDNSVEIRFTSQDSTSGGNGDQVFIDGIGIRGY